MSLFSPNDFPRLTAANHRLTSPPDVDYNCIAWAAGDAEHWWQPGLHWPAAAPDDDFGIAVLEQAFRELGYEDCGIDDGLGALREFRFLYACRETDACRQVVKQTWQGRRHRTRHSG
jgi:hypothetical protein